jgi:hypothetical protein
MASIDQTQNASFDIEWARGDNDRWAPHFRGFGLQERSSAHFLIRNR